MESWLEPLLDAETMRAVDSWAIDDRGVPSLELMEAAGRAVAEAALEAAGPGPARIVCGKGNNGGDGLVAARHLADAGAEVEVLLLWPAAELSADAAANLERLEGGARELAGGELAAALEGSGVVVDAIFGTGFSGAPREPAAAAIAAINACPAPVIAADIASGVDASTGEVEGAAVEAAVTVSFHAAKLGHWIAPGKRCAGELRVARIGVPDGAPGAAPGGLIHPSVLALLTERGADSTKFTSGQVLIAGGSRGLTGAVCMAAEAAVRAGAGYATVAVPAGLEPIFEVKLTEVMSIGCPDADGSLVPAAAERIADAAGRAAAVVVGPGLGRAAGASALVGELVRRVEAPMLIDADGLNALAGSLELLAERPGPTVLTPHAGELARLLETDSDAVGAHRLASATEAAARSGAVVVLKGDDSIVAAPGAAAIVNGLSSPALATAGTGDVLSGMVAAMLARGLDPRTAAAAAVHAHTRAGRIAAERLGATESVIATDVIAAIAASLRPGARGTRLRAVALIDPGAVERNCRRLRAELTGGATLCAVVKADGYGHGAVACARAALAAGAHRLAVATAAEAVELRAALPEAPLLVLGALTPDELELALEADADLAAWRPEFLELVAARARARGATARVHVKYDTGMGRLGARDPDRVSALVETAAGAEGVEPAGLWTHFATADELDSEFFDEQLERFRAVALPLRERHPGLVLHAANSAATLREPGSHFDMVRCGIAVYGLDPFGEDPAERGLEPALELRSYVADVKRFEPGASAGYGRTWRAPAETSVGVLPIGYGDGVRRGLSNNADVLVGGRRRPLVGTVSMDNVTIDLGAATEVEPGDVATLIGAQGSERILAEELAVRLGTINYEVTCGISARVPRELVGAR